MKINTFKFRTICLKAFKNDRREVVSFRFRTPISHIELDSFTYNLNKQSSLNNEFDDFDETDFDDEF